MVSKIAIGAPLLVLLVSGGCASTVAPAGVDAPRDVDAGAAKDSSGADGSVLGTDAAGGDGPPAQAETPGDSQTPPTGAASAVAQWLSEGAYRNWHCEPIETAGSAVSPHGAHRVCSNDKLSKHSGAGEFPAGAANVKEFYDAVGGVVIGHAVALHSRAGLAGDSWYWYEDRDGTGATSNGAAVPYCVNCHSKAGSYSGPAGHDFVFTQVP